jgi:Protein of unknown function (DUF4054)
MENFRICRHSGNYLNPTICEFKEYFFRDFPFGADVTTSILDQDIAKAYQQVNVAINPGLFANQENFSIGYLLLAAHWLVTNLRASAQGLSGQYSFLQASKGVGSVNESFSIPQRILDNPYFSMLAKTNYGMMYLHLILPQLTGQVYTVHGHTKA